MDHSHEQYSRKDGNRDFKKDSSAAWEDHVHFETFEKWLRRGSKSFSLEI
jgi:hypothetical protein